MQAASRAYVLAAAALAATSAVVVTVTGPRPSQAPVRSYETRLVDSESVLNIPINLFDDILNIPYNEIQGIDVLSDSLFFSGDWWVPNATNLWGTDPGDLGHYMGLIDILIPFAAISGLDQPEIDPTADADGTAGLAQQIALLAAAELPTSASCDAQTCAPIVPTDVITGSTAFDRDIEFLEALTGNTQFGLFDDWFQVPLSELTSGDFTFDSTTDPGGIVDPSPDTGADGDVNSGFGFDGTTGADGTNGGDMPWDGVTFQLNLFGPFEDFYNSLLATPSTSGVDGTGIELPTLTDITQAFQNLVASSIVAFDPFEEGSPVCPVTCDIPSSLTVGALVQDVENWDPSNTTIQEWLTDYAAGTESTATTTEAEDSIALLQTGLYNLTPEQLAAYDADLAAINPELPYLFTNGGIVTDPNYLAFADGTTTTFDPTYGGYDPFLLGSDLLTLFTNNDTNFSELTNIDVLEELLFPASGDPAASVASSAASSADTTTLSTELSSLLGGSDGSTTANDAASLAGLLGLSAASTLSTDFSALLSTLTTDLSSALSADLGSTLSTDLASILPSTVLSMF
jgi:hypothetical protein